MRPKAQIVRQIVKDEIDRDLLGTKPDLWNPSVSLSTKIGTTDGQGGRGGMAGGIFKELSNNHQKFMIKQGFQDETITVSGPQTTYAGCDTRDVYYHGWDVSNETTPPRDKER